MSYFIDALKVFAGMCMFSAFVLVMACILAMLPQKPHKMPKRTVWHDCPDEVVKIVNEFTSDAVGGSVYDWNAPFDQDEWEAKFASEGRV